MKTEEERQALQNLIDHFKINFTLVGKKHSHAKIKDKWFLILNKEKGLSSPTLDFNQMQHFIMGIGATNCKTKVEKESKFLWEYSVSTDTVWTSFDFGEVKAKTVESAYKKAKRKVKKDLKKCNSLLKEIGQTIEIDFDQLTIRLKDNQ